MGLGRGLGRGRGNCSMAKRRRAHWNPIVAVGVVGE